MGYYQRPNVSLELAPERIFLLLSSLTYLLVMHVFVPNLGGIIYRQTEYLIWLVSGGVIFVSVLKVLKERVLRKPVLTIYLLIFMLCWIGSVIFNSIVNLEYFLIRSIWLLGGFLIWLSFGQFENKGRERLLILNLIYISCVIQATIGIMQFFGLWKYLPIPPYYANGTFQQRNLFASYLSTGLVISLYFVSTTWVRNFGRIRKILFFSGVFLVSCLLFLSESRTGFIGLLFGMLLVFSSRRVHFRRNTRFFSLWVTLLLCGIMTGFLLPAFKDKIGPKEAFLRKAYWISKGAEASLVSRLFFYQTCVEMFLEKPLSGQGFSNAASLLMYYQERAKEKTKGLLKGPGNSFTHHPHNEIFLILAESGIVGIFGVLSLLYGWWRYSKMIGTSRTLLYTGLLSPILVHTMLEYPLHLSGIHYFTFFLLLALATSHFQEKVKLKLREGYSRLIRIGALFAFILFFVFIMRTVSAYNRLLFWERENLMGKNPSPQLLIPATENLYLRNWASQIYATYVADRALRDVRKNKEFLLGFLDWAKVEKRRWPTPTVFIYEAKVLLSLGRSLGERNYYLLAKNSLEQALKLYPENRELIILRFLSEHLLRAHSG